MKSIPLILLAAGRSSRMGTPKGLLKFKNVYWLEHQIQNYFSYGGEKVLIVLGDHCSEYQKVFSWLGSSEEWENFQSGQESGQEFGQDSGLESTRYLGQVAYVQNKNPQDGQFSSLQIALKFLLSQKFLQSKDSPKFEHILMLPVDVPLVDNDSLRKMISFFEVKSEDKSESECKVSIPRYQNKKGHPVLLSRRFCQYLVQQSLASNLRLDHIIRQLKSSEVEVVDVGDESVILNINTENDWRQYIASV